MENYYLLLAAIAVLSKEIANHSDLAEKIKLRLYLDLTQYKLIDKLSKVKTWFIALGYTLMQYLSPIILIVIGWFNVHKYLIKMINCEYCLSYHLGWIGLYTIYGMTLLNSFIYALPVLIIVGVINRIYGE